MARFLSPTTVHTTALCSDEGATLDMMQLALATRGFLVYSTKINCGPECSAFLLRFFLRREVAAPVQGRI